MRCSICDAPEAEFNFNNWHCGPCHSSIRHTVGIFDEEDLQYIVLGDDDTEVTPKEPPTGGD